MTPAYADGTALSGVDYTPNISAIRFSGTASEQHSFTVATTEDAEVEPDETFSVNLTVGPDGTGPVPAEDAPNVGTAPGTGTIENDDRYRIVVTAKIGLSSDPDSLSEDADPVTVELTATADGAVSSERTVTVSVGAAGDGAVEGTDYAVVDDFDLTIPANAAAGTSTFTLAPTNDDIVEADETITVSGTGKDMDVEAATITLKDGDTAAVALALSPESISENGGVSTVTATLSAAADEETVVTVSLAPVAPGAAEDATLTGTTLVIPAGETVSTGDVTVTAVDNAAVEADRTFTVSGTASGGRGAADPDDEDLLVLNDDRANLTVEDAAIREGRPLKFTIVLDNDVDGGVSVTPALSDITARAGVDYEAGVAPLHFAGVAGETGTVSVPTIQDDLIEGAERFSLRLTATPLSGGIGVRSAAATGVGLFVDEGATGTIRDDDRAKLTIADASAEEGEVVAFTVTLDHDVPGGVTATPSFTDGSATAGADYRANPRTLRFAGRKGETRTIAVETIQDQLVENDETFTVSLEAATSVKVEAGEGATGTIRDNDETIEVSVSLTPDTVAEGETARFAIALSAPSNEVPVTVDYATVEGTATAGVDYESASGTATFQPGETRREIPVLVLDDVKNEPVETFSLRISNLAGGPTVLGAAEATAFIDEADPMPAAWLARFGRAAADHAVEAVTERMENGAAGSGVQVPAGGNDLLSGFGGGTAWAANGGRPVGVLPNGDPSPLAADDRS